MSSFDLGRNNQGIKTDILVALCVFYQKSTGHPKVDNAVVELIINMTGDSEIDTNSMPTAMKFCSIYLDGIKQKEFLQKNADLFKKLIVNLSRTPNKTHSDLVKEFRKRAYPPTIAINSVSTIRAWWQNAKARTP